MSRTHHHRHLDRGQARGRPAPLPELARDPDLRASDAERERVAEELGVHAAEGRLKGEELEERLEKAYAANTLGDLEAVLKELPQRPRETAAPEQRHERGRHGPLAAHAPVAVALVVVGLLSVVLGTGAVWFGLPLVLWALGGRGLNPCSPRRPAERPL
jgi:DUF1707 SHOCT-like domain